MLSRLVACAGEEKIPESWSKALLRQHCFALGALTSKYRDRWLARTRPFLHQLVPADIPTAVVYPFGGGDLVTALTTFPNAREFTTISLESAGDVHRLAALTPRQLRESLAVTREHLRCLFAVSHSKTTNLHEGARSSLPGEIAFAMVAFAIFDYEPVSLRYFRLDPQGNLVYLNDDELGPAGAAKSPGPSPTANVEIAFRPRQDPQAPPRIFRHVAANLDDAHFAANHPLALHLAQKGRVSVLIKAASYLLWFDSFSHIRSYLLDRAEWMISDSTGIPSSLARAAGFEQECYGLFHGPMLARHSRWTRETVALWQASPKRMLPFYFGYPDVDGHGHLMITRRAKKDAGASPGELATDQVSEGTHWRLLTNKGPVHVWQPRGYEPASAGTVIYVHGYYTNVDRAWVEHALAEQFASSKANALFVVPEAPAGSEEEVAWPSLGELLREVERQAVAVKAKPPYVLVGHSGAWRTLTAWTEEPQVKSILLLDGLYGNEDKLLGWLARHKAADTPRLTLVSYDTASRVDPFLAQVVNVNAKRRAHLPETYRDLTPNERSAGVLEIHSDLGHMEIVTTGKVLPVLLQRSELSHVKPPPRFVKRRQGTSR